MANLKTSQENSGAPILTNDLWRIARGGSNYKLTSEELFSETLTILELGTKASANDLIAGRKYKVTGVGTGNTYSVIVTAIDSGKYSTSNHIVDSGNNIIEGCLTTMDSNLSNNMSYLDNRGNLFLQNIVNPNILGGYNIIEGVNTINPASNTYCDNSYLKNVVIFNQVDLYIQNCSMENVTIVTDNNQAIYITNCNLKNCTIELQTGTILTNVTIIDDNTETYVFDNENINGGTLIKSEFNTLQKDIDFAIYYDIATGVLTLPSKSKWVGIFNLINQPNSSDTIEKIIGCENYFTPIIFKQMNPTGTISFNHSNTIGGVGTDEIVFASNHTSNDHLDTPQSFAKMLYDGLNTFWRCEQVVNYNA